MVANDLAEATRWYNDISLDLGNRFRRAISSRFDSVELRPESFGRVSGELRAARVDGFPYLVIFEIYHNVTHLLGVFHAASDPTKWTQRPR